MNSDTKTSPQRLAANRAWKERNREAVGIYAKNRWDKISKDQSLKAAKNEKYRQWKKNNPEKVKAYESKRDRLKLNARALIRNWIYRGKIKRGNCQVCGIPNAEAHHPDYSKPSEVIWLCRKHHDEVHSRAYQQSTSTDEGKEK